MIEELLPRTIASSEAFGDLDGSLFDEERSAVEKARESRRNEFITGRICARRALLQLGESASAVPVGLRGSPQWPRGVVGSIAHCTGYRVAAVGRTTSFLSIGLDAEPNEPLPDGIVDSIITRTERERLDRNPDRTVHWDRLTFSAKEAVYKAWFPITHRWLGWHDVSITFCPHTGAFESMLALELSPGERSLRKLSGRWLVQRGLVVTAVLIPREAQ